MDLSFFSSLFLTGIRRRMTDFLRRFRWTLLRMKNMTCRWIKHYFCRCKKFKQNVRYSRKYIANHANLKPGFKFSLSYIIDRIVDNTTQLRGPLIGLWVKYYKALSILKYLSKWFSLSTTLIFQNFLQSYIIYLHQPNTVLLWKSCTTYGWFHPSLNMNYAYLHAHLKLLDRSSCLTY